MCECIYTREDKCEGSLCKKRESDLHACIRFQMPLQTHGLGALQSAMIAPPHRVLCIRGMSSNTLKSTAKGFRGLGLPFVMSARLAQAFRVVSVGT